MVRSQGVVAATTASARVATARFFRVLADPTRLAILELLLDRERTVRELVEAIGAPQSRISNHLACLRWCGVVEATKNGRNITYSLADQQVRGVIERGRSLAERHCEQLASCRRVGPDWV